MTAEYLFILEFILTPGLKIWIHRKDLSDKIINDKNLQNAHIPQKQRETDQIESERQIKKYRQRQRQTLIVTEMTAAQIMQKVHMHRDSGFSLVTHQMTIGEVIIVVILEKY